MFTCDPVVDCVFFCTLPNRPLRPVYDIPANTLRIACYTQSLTNWLSSLSNCYPERPRVPEGIGIPGILMHEAFAPLYSQQVRYIFSILFAVRRHIATVHLTTT